MKRIQSVFTWILLGVELYVCTKDEMLNRGREALAKYRGVTVNDISIIEIRKNKNSEWSTVYYYYKDKNGYRNPNDGSYAIGVKMDNQGKLHLQPIRYGKPITEKYVY